MHKEELQALLAEFSAGVNKAINDNIEGVKAEFSAQIAEVNKGVTEGFAKIDAEKAAAELAAQKKAEEDAEKERLALEAKEKADKEAADKLEAQRSTLQFGTRVGKFEGDDDAQKAIVANDKLSPAEQFRALIELKLQQAK